MHCTPHKVSALHVCVVGEDTVLDALCVLVRFQFGYTVISPLHCGAAMASGEPRACSRWAVGLLKCALGPWPRPTITTQGWALFC